MNVTLTHPQTDEQTEAMNRVVEMVLRCILHESQKSSHWEAQLGILEFVINNSPSQSTGYTPFFLNFGYHPATQLDILRDVDSSRVETVQVFTRRMQQAFSRATHYLHRAQQRQKVQADRRRREQTFHIGDQVLLSTKNLNLKNTPPSKLRKRFVGPFYVIRSIGPVAYELELPQTWRIHPVFHTSLLRPFRTSAWQRLEEIALDEIQEEDERSYEVERLLRWRYVGPSGKRITRSRKKEYLVLWKNFSLDDASWTHENNFDYPEELQKMIDRDKPVNDNAN